MKLESGRRAVCGVATRMGQARMAPTKDLIMLMVVWPDDCLFCSTRTRSVFVWFGIETASGLGGGRAAARRQGLLCDPKSRHWMWIDAVPPGEQMTFGENQRGSGPLPTTPPSIKTAEPERAWAGGRRTETGGRWRSVMLQVVESETAIDVRECAHPILPLGGASPRSSTSGH